MTVKMLCLAFREGYARIRLPATLYSSYLPQTLPDNCHSITELEPAYCARAVFKSGVTCYDNRSQPENVPLTRVTKSKHKDYWFLHYSSSPHPRRDAIPS
jgi:hypothetical protein